MGSPLRKEIHAVPSPPSPRETGLVYGRNERLRTVARRAVWLTVYLLFVLAPVLALLMGDVPPARDFWTEFSSAIAYVGLAMMGLQFGLTARFRYVTEPWGEDVIYHFHRLLSLVALAVRGRSSLPTLRRERH